MVETLCDALKNNCESHGGREVVVAPPSLYLRDAQSRLADSVCALASQDCSAYAEGAYTGEVSASMLADLRIPFVILGHSERRALFGETDEVVGRKVAQALANAVKVIACIGETLEQRESGDMYAVLERQLAAIQEAVGAEPSAWANVVVAYEPVWAIGTGVVATPKQAQEVHAWVREWMSAKVSTQVSDALRVIYGGSVKAENARVLKDQPDIDGFLVGGASLKADEFLRIVGC